MTLTLSYGRQLFEQRINSLYNTGRLPWIAIGIGIILRFAHYIDNRSLWVDESVLALDIVNRSLAELMGPLSASTGAPAGFLALVKFSVEVFGESEFALRLVPLLAGIGSLFLFYWVARRYLAPTATFIALTLFAISPWLIRWSSELKQYSVDVFVAVLLIFITTEVSRRNLSLVWLFVYAIAGAASIWLSYPSVFVIAGLGISLALPLLVARNWVKLIPLGIVFVIWLASFGVSFQTSAVSTLVSDEKGIVSFLSTSSRFMPLPPTSISDLQWFVTTFFGTFDNPVGISLPGIAVLTFLFGCVAMYKKNRYLLFGLVSPAIFALLASGLALYPFADRWILFLAPSLILLIGAGVDQIFEKTRATYPVMGIAIALLLFFSPLSSTGRELIRPTVREEMKPVMNYVSTNQRSDDLLYVYYAAVPAFRFYADDFGLDNANFVFGVSSRGNVGVYVEDLDRLSGNDRVWIIFSHIHRTSKYDEEIFFLEYLDSIGTRLDSFGSPGSVAYLYDLTKSANSTP